MYAAFSIYWPRDVNSRWNKLLAVTEGHQQWHSLTHSVWIRVSVPYSMCVYFVLLARFTCRNLSKIAILCTVYSHPNENRSVRISLRCLLWQNQNDRSTKWWKSIIDMFAELRDRRTDRIAITRTALAWLNASCDETRHNSTKAVVDSVRPSVYPSVIRVEWSRHSAFLSMHGLALTLSSWPWGLELDLSTLFWPNFQNHQQPIQIVQKLHFRKVSNRAYMWNEIILKLFWNYFSVLSHKQLPTVFYFTCNHVWNWNIIISNAERVLKLFQNYFGDIEHVGKYSSAANYITLWNNFEIISGKFPRAEVKSFQTDVDEGWNNFEIILFHM